MSYINDVLKPFNYICELNSPYDSTQNTGVISETKNELDLIVSAYTDRFNYIIRKLKEKRNLEIKYIMTSFNSNFNIFFKDIDKKSEQFQQIENFVKANFHASAFENYFIEDISIENIKKVKKLSHDSLNTLIENHLNSLIYKKQLLFLHPYHYAKINDHFEFSESQAAVNNEEKHNIFNSGYICSSLNIDHILKNLIRTFTETDSVDNLIHPIYYKSRSRHANKENGINRENSASLKKKILKSGKFDYPLFPIYIIETYFFPKEHKTVHAYSVQDVRCKDDKGFSESVAEITKQDYDHGTYGTKNVKESPINLYFTLPKHTNLKYIIYINLENNKKTKMKKEKEMEWEWDKRKEKGKEKEKENTETTKEKTSKDKSKERERVNGNIYNKRCSNENLVLQSMTSSNKANENENPINFFMYINETDENVNNIMKSKVESELLHFLYNFQYINFFSVTKYFIELSKIVCVIKKVASSLFYKMGIPVEEFNQSIPEKWDINIENDIKELYKKKRELNTRFKQLSNTQTEENRNETQDKPYKNNSTDYVLNETEEINKKNIQRKQSNETETEKKMNNSVNMDEVTDVREVTKLYLNSLNISKLKIKALINYSGLKELHLRNNNISNLNFFCFDSMDLENLEVINLACNNIVDLTPLYKKFVNLKYVDLSFNYLNDYTQILQFSIYHKNVEHLIILNNSFYVKPEYYSTIHFFFPQIKKFNHKNIVDNTHTFDITNYAFISTELNETVDEYILFEGNRDMISDSCERYINAKEILKGEPILQIYKHINATNYYMFVKVFNLSNLHISLNFWDFSKFLNLQILNLSNNGIQFLDKLQIPKNLKVLNLQNNKLVSLDFITHTNFQIEKIILDNNRLTNIDQILNLKKLKVLRVSNNKIENIPIFQHFHLTELNIHNNLIKDITPLALIKHKNSLITLNLYNNPISFAKLDLYLIHLFPSLLFLNNSVVQRKPNLDKLFKNILTPDLFFDMYRLHPPFNNLVALDLHNLKIKKISFHINNDNFKKLKVLDLSNNYITDVNDIGPLDNLKVLTLNNNKHITESSFKSEGNHNTLNSFKSLEELNISNCALSKTSFLKNCDNLKNLKILNLEGNNISTITCIEIFKNLKHLNLSNNKISKIKHGCLPITLEKLHLSNNLIRQLSPLSNLHKLEALDIRVNRVENIDEFKKLQSLQNLKTLHINGNRKIKEYFLVVKGILPQIENFDIKLTPTEAKTNHQAVLKPKKEDNIKHILKKDTTQPLPYTTKIKPIINTKGKMNISTLKKKTTLENPLKNQDLTVFATKIEKTRK